MKYLYVPLLFVIAVVYVNHFDSENPKLLVSLKDQPVITKNIGRKVASVKDDNTSKKATWYDSIKNLFK